MADKYNYLKLVGKGSFGKAWLVQSKSSQRQYVVKEIQVANMADKDRHQAVNEVAILARLKHKNVVRYREAFVEAGSLNIVMAYASGGDLGHHVQQARSSNTSLPESQVMGWFVQIMFALVYIHDLKILHRDLKPQNIFLTKDDIIKIGDFGIARALKDSQDRANTAIGTPYYLSPEICRRQPYNHKSDMWAAGCVLYELLTLHHPFEADDFSLLVLKILRGKYKDIASNYGPLPGDLVSVLLRVNPDRRPSSEQILTIPAIRRYVQEYTSRSSSRQSTTSVSETSSATVGNHGEVESRAKVFRDKEALMGDDHVIMGEAHPANEPSVLAPRVTIESRQKSAVVAERKESASVGKSKQSADNSRVTKCNSTAKDRSGRCNTNMNCDTTAHRKRCEKARGSDRGLRRIYSDSSVSRRRDDTKRKLPALSVQDNEVSSSLISRNREDPRLFSKDAIKTIKRRKYSCITPVAPKVASHLGTPKSEKSRNWKHLIGQESEGTPPAVRLFGNRAQSKGIALRDGWSPDVSPRFRTRVLRKELAVQKGNASVKDTIRTKQQSEVSDSVGRSSLQVDQGDVDDVVSSTTVTMYSDQKSKNCEEVEVETSALISGQDEGSNDTECRRDNNMCFDVKTTSHHQSCQDSVNRLCKIQREVNDMLLSCTPCAAESRTDIQAKMELLKMFLERRLGSENAVFAYGVIAKGTAEGKRTDDILDEVQAFLPSGSDVYTPLLIQIRCLEEWCNIF